MNSMDPFFCLPRSVQDSLFMILIFFFQVINFFVSLQFHAGRDVGVMMHNGHEMEARVSNMVKLAPTKRINAASCEGHRQSDGSMIWCCSLTGYCFSDLDLCYEYCQSFYPPHLRP